MPNEVYNPYVKYGVRRAINAAGTLTRVGGSISPPEVFRAMEDASKSFVHISELQQWAGGIISEATGAEAGLPTAGGSCSIMLAAAACIMKGTELERYEPKGRAVWRHIIQRLPAHTEGLRTEFIVQKANRDEYDHAVEIAGGRFVEVGTEEGATEGDLDEAFNAERTAAYYFTVQPSSKCLPLETVVRVAHRNGVPVIVDASAELPPRSNLRHYVSKGVDLVTFSGGKTISGPNNSGILAGKADLIKLAHLQSYPFEGVGRVAKMSRETIVGLVTALKIYLEVDEVAEFEAWEQKARSMAGELGGMPGVEAGVVYSTTPEGVPKFPLVYLRLDEGACGISGGELHRGLVDGDPSIEGIYEPYYLLEDYEGKLVFNPQNILEGEELIILQRVKEILKL
ncbi:MAG: aminotransferase class V-fold PLP-dependent enzyme [Candidatus Bathyarchaeota archaeon]|nr:aminotransferase class V-fold PLP-dependent enzyme [Candidatus Bathyarchaeota archaeon]